MKKQACVRPSKQLFSRQKITKEKVLQVAYNFSTTLAKAKIANLADWS